MNTLRIFLEGVARGYPPTPDGKVLPEPRPPGPVSDVLGFAARHHVLADVDPRWVSAQLPWGDLTAPLSPAFLHALAGQIKAVPGCLDVVLAATSLPGAPPLALVEVDGADHARARRAERYRTDVRTWTTRGGMLVIGRGLADRWEAAFEVEPKARGRGLGRALAGAARHLVPQGSPLFMQVSPGNVPSMRAVIAAGFNPIGAEVLFLHT